MKENDVDMAHVQASTLTESGRKTGLAQRYSAQRHALNEQEREVERERGREGER